VDDDISYHNEEENEEHNDGNEEEANVGLSNIGYQSSSDFRRYVHQRKLRLQLQRQF